MKTGAKYTAKKGAPPKTWHAGDTLALLAFLIWSCAGLYFTINHVTPATVARWHLSPNLRQFVGYCMDYGDIVLIVLAFINTHLHAARQWADGAARTWCVLILVCAYGIECFGTITTFPFGEYHYTNKFGPMIYLVPATIPLAWHIVLTNTLFVVRAILADASPMTESLLAAILCTAYDYILEPFATTQKHYWNWAGGAVPGLNYIAWFILSALLIRLFAPALSTQYRLDPRPWLVLGLTLAIFIANGMR